MIGRKRPPTVRLVSEGTRVVVLRPGGSVSGVVSDVRPQIGLRAYEVTCDDGSVLFASGADLAREDDPTVTPLGRKRED